MSAAFGKTPTRLERAEAVRSASYKIFDYLRKYGLIQRDFARQTNIPQTCISALISGRRPCTFYYAMIIEVRTGGELKAADLVPYYAEEIRKFKELK